MNEELRQAETQSPAGAFSCVEAGLGSAAPGRPAGAVRLERFAHRAMACTWEIWIRGEPTENAAGAAQAAFAEVDRLEQLLSRFIPHSEIAQLNAAAADAAVRVSVETLECLELAQQVYRATSGAFDVTLGSGKGTEAEPPLRLRIDRRTRTVTKATGAIRVDLGGIGKGFALDGLVEVLSEWGVTIALAHCGQSTVRAVGFPPNSAGWPIAIRDPRNPAAVLGRVTLRDEALGGSGVLLHGQHIVDPRTRQPARGALGAWTAAPSAALADAYSTAFMVLTQSEVECCCAREHISALLMLERQGQAEQVSFGPIFAAIAQTEH